jgi:2-aminoadipate transaminase
VIAPESLHFKLVQAKQATDLHTPILTQRIVYEAIQDNFLDRHVPTVRALYKAQCEAMLDALKASMPDGVKWNDPQGGMFVWLTLPAHIDTMKLLSDSIERKVAFVPGAPFYANAAQHNTMRLCFSTVSAERIREGVRILAELIANCPEASGNVSGSANGTSQATIQASL